MSQLPEHLVVGPSVVGPSVVGSSVVGDGPDTLLFLHGLGGDCRNWAPQLDVFAATHRCIAWTLPGYGDSPPLDGPLTWPALASAAVALLDALDVERATVVGLSMGGYIGQQMALDHSDRLDQLVLVATSSAFAGGSKAPGNAAFREKYLASRLAPLDEGRTPADLAPNVVPMLLSDAAADGAHDNCVASMSKISVAAYRAALSLLVTWDVDDRLGEITVPTLCVAGELDKTAPPKSLQRIADRVVDGRYVEIAGSNHLVNLDQPAAFNAAVTGFITT